MVSPPALRPSTASDAPVGEALDKLKPALAEVGAEIDRLLDSLLAVPEDSRDRLYHAMRHAAIGGGKRRSEEHTSELQSLMRISYAVFCLKKKTQQKTNIH